jgi:hypothetical protein
MKTKTNLNVSVEIHCVNAMKYGINMLLYNLIQNYSIERMNKKLKKNRNNNPKEKSNQIQ